jgi:hypothetical protein
MEVRIGYLECHLEEAYNARGLIDLHQNSKYIRSILDAIAKQCDSGHITTISLDVFDTILLRNPECEARRFWNFSKELSSKLDGAVRHSDIFLARTLGARISYGHSPLFFSNREGTFSAISKLMAEQLYDKELAKLIVANELECEAKQVEVSPLLESIRTRFPDKQIIFLSDMYLESELIASMLRKKRALHSSDVVYSSADGIGSKRVGSVFQYIQRVRKQPPKEFVHIGDSFKGDYRNAKVNGWGSVFTPTPMAERIKRTQCFNQLASELSKEGLNVHKYINFNM